MDNSFSFKQFLTLFPNDDVCLEAIKTQRFPNGIYCRSCQKITKHYKLKTRIVYSCALCRRHVYPLAGTIFEKSSTPLRMWFFALFLMTHTRGTISKKQLQRELGVTYKTAWRIYRTLYIVMKQERSLLQDPSVYQQDDLREHKWVFFKRLEIKVVQKQKTSEEEH